MRILMLARTIGAALAIAAGTVPAAHGAQQATPLTSRIATAGPDVIGHFEAAGMRSVRPYLLTPAELGWSRKRSQGCRRCIGAYWRPTCAT